MIPLGAVFHSVWGPLHIIAYYGSVCQTRGLWSSHLSHFLDCFDTSWCELIMPAYCNQMDNTRRNYLLLHHHLPLTKLQTWHPSIQKSISAGHTSGKAKWPTISSQATGMFAKKRVLSFHKLNIWGAVDPTQGICTTSRSPPPRQSPSARLEEKKARKLLSS